MIANRLLFAALALAALPVAACTIERAPAQQPPPATAAAPAPAPANPEAFKQICAIGTWKADGPAGPQEVMITQGNSQSELNVSYKGQTIGQGQGQVTGNQMTVDLGKSTGGIYSCNIDAECKSMSCGFAGLPPATFHKL